MTIDIQSPHITIEPALHKLITEKVNKLLHFDQDIIGAEVFLLVDNAHDTHGKICEINLEVPGKNLFANKKAATHEEAVTLATEALKQQINHTSGVKSILPRFSGLQGSYLTTHN